VPIFDAIGGDRLGVEYQSKHSRMCISDFLSHLMHVFGLNDPS